MGDIPYAWKAMSYQKERNGYSIIQNTRLYHNYRFCQGFTPAIKTQKPRQKDEVFEYI